MIFSKKHFSIYFLLLIVIFFVAREVYISYQLKKKVRYTIGVIKRISSSVEGGPVAEFAYNVYGKEYKNLFNVSENESRIKVHDTIIIKFNVKDPSICYPLTQYLIKNITNVSDSGWSEIEKILSTSNQSE